MEKAAVVPHHQIAEPPAVVVAEARLIHVFAQPFVQPLALLERVAADLARGVAGEIERAPVVPVGMDADQGMRDGREGVPFGRRRRGHRRLEPPDAFVAMHHVQRLEPTLHVIRQGLVGEEHVREAGLAALCALRQHLDTVEDRGQRRHEPVRAIRVPAGIVALEDHPWVFRGQMRSLGRDVGDVIDLDLPLRLVLLGKGLQGAELLRERRQLVVAQSLVAEAQHVVVLEGLAHAR